MRAVLPVATVDSTPIVSVSENRKRCKINILIGGKITKLIVFQQCHIIII
jgi:hypothetical protein